MTIIVLLILTGVSLNAIVGDNGIIKQAQKASNKADLARFIEDAEMAYSDVYAERTQEYGMRN